MKFSRLSRFAGALSASVLLVSCATEQQPADERFVVIPEEESLELVFPKEDVEHSERTLEPGKIYLGEDIDGIFKLQTMQSVVNEDGHLAVVVRGSTEPYSFWTWLWKGEKDRRIAYRFLWFDKDGKLIATLLNSVPGTRICLPGDPVRFSGLAQDEHITQFSIVLNLLDEKEMGSIKEAQAIKGAALDEMEPVKKDPLKEVKIEK